MAPVRLAPYKLPITDATMALAVGNRM